VYSALARLCLVAPFILIAVPTRVLEAAPSLCLSRVILGRSCPGCGMSRAISCVLHGDLAGALRHNRMIPVVFPVLCYLWFRAARSALPLRHA